MSLENSVYQAIAGNGTITDLLTTFLEGPAIFKDRVPEEFKGFPYITFKMDGAAGNTHFLQENITVEFSVYDKRSGHSTNRADLIVRALEEMFDHQTVVDIDGHYRAARCWFEGRTVIADGSEKDDSIHVLMNMTIRAYRQFMATELSQ